MNNTPFATIIIPTYNQAAYLGEALDSLIQHSDPDWEAIVVNDGSTDNTREVLERYANMDARIRCIHQPNGGVASALTALGKGSHGSILNGNYAATRLSSAWNQQPSPQIQRRPES